MAVLKLLSTKNGNCHLLFKNPSWKEKDFYQFSENEIDDGNKNKN